MVFGIAKLVSYVSEFMTLEHGDIITIGAPPVTIGWRRAGETGPNR